MHKIEEILSTSISYCLGSYKTQTYKITIKEALEEIASEKFKNEIEIIRAIPEKKNSIKKSLKAYIFAGEFSIRNDSSLISSSNLCILDFDDIPSENVNSVKKQLASDRYIVAAWTSPSALGIKALVRFQNNEPQLRPEDASKFHKHAYKQFSHYLEEKHSLSLDPTGCNISRLCYSSYDPQIIIKDSFEDFAVFDYVEVKNNLYSKEKTSSTSKVFDETKVKNITRKGNALYRRKLKSIIKYLSKSQQTITENYEKWYIVGQAIANTFSYNIGKEYYLRLCRLDGKKHSEEKSQNKLIECYTQSNICESNRHVGFPTIEALALEKGWNQSSKEK